MNEQALPQSESGTQQNPSFKELLAVFFRIGVTSFGGPAGQIALMHRELVEERPWLTEKQYLAALNFCMLLPGPEAMQLATYAGWRIHGLAGGIVAGLLFVLPGALIVLALALLYASFGQLPLVETVFLGIKAAVLAIVMDALIRVARRALHSQADWIVAGLAFLAIFAFNVPFPVVVLAAAIFGAIKGGTRKAADATGHTPGPKVTIAQTAGTIAVGLLVWLAPLAAIIASFGWDHVLSQIAVFFSKLAVVTFGGAYAVLAYMAQDVVQSYGWLEAGEMLDALGLAETTPGPLILVTEFVATLAGWRHGGGASLGMALLAAVVSLWATFAPCFLWIFAGAPYIERLNREPRLSAALAAVTAAVVGVILNLSVWFALHVLFARVTTREAGPLHLSVPDWSSLNWSALGLLVIAAIVLFVFRRGVLTTLSIMTVLALLLSALSGPGL